MAKDRVTVAAKSHSRVRRSARLRSDMWVWIAIETVVSGGVLLGLIGFFDWSPGVALAFAGLFCVVVFAGAWWLNRLISRRHK